MSAKRKQGLKEKSAALHSPMNKRLNGGGHHPYQMHSRSIMNGLATSSSPSSLSKTLDTITTSGASHHSFHRHWLDMASDSAANMMDVDGAADDGSMAAAAAAAAAALLFSPPSSVGGGGGGISPGGPLSALHPNTHLAAHHHALSPLAPLALPHSAASVGLTSAHHHHHIQQQLQQYAAAAVAAATAAAAAAAAASTANDSATSPPPTLPLALPPMAHHYGQGCGQGVGGGSSTKRRSSGGAGLTVQQQLYRRSGTPTSSAASSPSPRMLNSKNDADTTTSSAGLHENGIFSASVPPTTTTTVLWPPLGLLTAAHQQHHHSLSSPPKFQQLFGSSVNSLTAATVGSQILSSLPPPPPISSPSSLPYRPVAKETNGTTAVTTSNGNDVGTGTAANARNVDEEDAAMDEDDDEEDEEDEEEEEEEDLDDDELEEGEEDGGDEEEDGDKTTNGGRAQARRLRRQQVRRLRRLRREGGGNAANNANDCADSGVSTNYHQQWPKPSTTSSTSLSQQQQSIGSSTQQHVDPERLKAFNMFVRLFVDENLDRQVPISRQPKDKVQAIIDSCGRQFPELSDRSRKRIRTYLKSCRRNKRNTPQSGGAVSSSPPPSVNSWPANGSSTDSTVQPQRPTPAHLTSAQAETILAVACQRESDNARRMRLGLEPVAQPYPYSVATSAAAATASNAFQQSAGASSQQNGNNGAGTLHASSASSDEDAAGFDNKTSSEGAVAERHNGDGEGADNLDGRDSRREGSVSALGGGDATTDTNNSVVEESNVANVNSGASVTSSSPNNCESAGPTDLSVNKSAAATVSTTPSSLVGAGAYAPGFRGLSSLMAPNATAPTVNHHHHHHHNRRAGGSSGGSSTATGMLQLFPSMATASAVPSTASTLGQAAAQQPGGSKLLNKADVVTVRQLIAGYRESAAFLLRSADELEHLLLLRG